jgi:hypothetical protein
MSYADKLKRFEVRNRRIVAMRRRGVALWRIAAVFDISIGRVWQIVERERKR